MCLVSRTTSIFCRLSEKLKTENQDQFPDSSSKQNPLAAFQASFIRAMETLWKKSFWVRGLIWFRAKKPHDLFPTVNATSNFGRKHTEHTHSHINNTRAWQRCTMNIFSFFKKSVKKWTKQYKKMFDQNKANVWWKDSIARA